MTTQPALAGSGDFQLRPQPAGRGSVWWLGPGFTLLELLVVIGIMGIVAAVSLPAIKSWNRSNVTASASRQLLDDLALARLRAISTRSTVYMVFLPPPPWVPIGNLPWDARDLPLLTNLLSGSYATYALYGTRQVGDQPGGTNGQYESGWNTLPDGTFIATNKYAVVVPPLVVNGVRAFTNSVVCPFPSSISSTRMKLPCVAFDYLGRLTSKDDEVIPLARGTISPARGASKQVLLSAPALVSQNPPLNSINQSNHIRVDLLTGRSRVEKWEMP